MSPEFRFWEDKFRNADFRNADFRQTRCAKKVDAGFS
jgi:hypothetical protein